MLVVSMLSSEKLSHDSALGLRNFEGFGVWDFEECASGRMGRMSLVEST